MSQQNQVGWSRRILFQNVATLVSYDLDYSRLPGQSRRSKTRRSFFRVTCCKPRQYLSLAPLKSAYIDDRVATKYRIFFPCSIATISSSRVDESLPLFEKAWHVHLRLGDQRGRNHRPWPSTYTGALNQSDAVSCHFGFLFPGQVNFRLRAIFLILTLIIGEEDIAVGILGLNGKEDWPWDPTDEMNFQ